MEKGQVSSTTDIKGATLKGASDKINSLRFR